MSAPPGAPIAGDAGQHGARSAPAGARFAAGDRVRVTISGIGTIDNPVVQGE